MVACYSGSQQGMFDIESASTAWAEVSTTFTYGIPLAAPFDLSGVSQDMLDAMQVTARRNAYNKGVLGTWQIGYSTTHNLTGHGSTCAGAITATAQVRLMGHVLGGRDTTLAAGTTLTGGTATIPTTTSSSTLPAGGLVRIGALGDGDGEGQFYPVATHTAQNLTLLSDLAGAPVNGAVLYSPELAFPADSSCTLTGMRHQLLTGDLQMRTFGVFGSGISYTGLEPGGRPQWTAQWTGSRPTLVAGTFPTTPAADTFAWQPPSAGGSLMIQDVGTTTRTLYGCRAFSIDYTLGISPVTGGAGIDQYQVITGATRTKDTIIVNITVDANGASTTPFWYDKFGARTNQHMTYTLHSADGTAVGFYFRNLCWTGKRPTQSTMNDRNVITLQFRADVGATTTSDLTLAPMVIAFA